MACEYLLQVKNVGPPLFIFVVVRQQFLLTNGIMSVFRLYIVPAFELGEHLCLQVKDVRPPLLYLLYFCRCGTINIFSFKW